MHPSQPDGVFDKAIIAPDTNDAEGGYQGTPFIGVFDGNGHTISRLTIEGISYLGLFGQLGSGATVNNLGLDAVYVYGTGYSVGGLVGDNDRGTITRCYSRGTVSGGNYVGGLVGSNDGHFWQSGGVIIHCHTNSEVSGGFSVGGLVGINYSYGDVTDCYSTSSVSGTECVGGLVGSNGELSEYQLGGNVNYSYSAGAVIGVGQVGGLVGGNYGTGTVTRSYAVCTIQADESGGGLRIGR